MSICKLSWRSHYKKWIILGFVLSFFSGCLPVINGAPSTIKIGLIAPFEGLHRPLGYEVLFAAKLAIQERNSGTGLAGYRVELVALNDFEIPERTDLQARALITDPDIVGVVGHLSAKTTLSALPIYQAANIAVSSPWSLPPNVKSDGLVSLAANQHQTDSYLIQFIEEQNLQIVNIDQFDREATLQAEAIKLDMDGVAGGEYLQQISADQRPNHIFGQLETGSRQIIQVAGEAANGLIFVSPGPGPDDVVTEDNFVAAYQGMAGFPPGPRAILAYDATQVLLDAIEQSIKETGATPTRVAVSQSIRKIERKGLSGDIAFDPDGRRIDPPLWIYQIKDAQYPGVRLAP